MNIIKKGGQVDKDWSIISRVAREKKLTKKNFHGA